MTPNGKIWNWLVWTLFVLLIGIFLGQFYRISQVEPNFLITVSEIKQYNRLIAKDITELDVRLILLEKKIYGMRVKP